MNGPAQPPVEREVRFVATPRPGDVVLLSFSDPEESHAVMSSETAGNAARVDDAQLLVRIVSADERQAAAEWMSAPGPGQQSQSPVVKSRNGQVLWRPGRAVITSTADQEELVTAVVEFAFYEQQLRTLELETAAAWPGLDEDKALAFDVTGQDLRRSGTVGERMGATLQRRITLARLEPHLYSADAMRTDVARKLGDELRSQADLEGRAEVLDGQIGVFEHIYEMGSQRMGEYRASRQAHIVEWVIILLLAAETMVMLWQAVFRVRG